MEKKKNQEVRQKEKKPLFAQEQKRKRMRVTDRVTH